MARRRDRVSVQKIMQSMQMSDKEIKEMQKVGRTLLRAFSCHTASGDTDHMKKVRVARQRPWAFS